MGDYISMARLVALFLLAGSMGVVRAGTLIHDDFNALDWRKWSPCQINMDKAPVRIHPDIKQSGNYVLRITVDEASIGGNDCGYREPGPECRIPPGAGVIESNEDIDTDPDFPEPLGPSLVRRDDLEVAAISPYCDEPVLELVRAAGQERCERCIQRQELRFQRQYRHDAAKPHRYSFRFRMPHSIENRTDSIRWIIAQWKQTSVNGRYESVLGKGWGPSPILATRFDDGVLHVTVQDEHCRCKVASALYPDKTKEEWKDGKLELKHCASTRDNDPQRKPCKPPTDLIALYGPDPVLSSPLGKWIEMSYRVQTGWDGNAIIEVYEGGRFIVRVTGRIGYEPEDGKKNEVKFKIGHYRDFMPYVHAMDIDWIVVEPVSKETN